MMLSVEIFIDVLYQVEDVSFLRDWVLIILQ